MKFLVLFNFYVFMFCALFCKAQNLNISNFLDFEKQIYLKDTILYREFQYEKSSDSDEILLCFYNAKIENTDTIAIYILNTKTDSITKELYYIKNIGEYLLKNYAYSFKFLILSQKYLILSTNQTIYLFERQNMHHINMLKQDFTFNATGGYFLEDSKLFLYKNYNNHKNDAKFKTKFYILTLPNFELISEIIPDFDIVEYTHIKPNHWVEANNNNIYFSSTINYKINVYNDKLEHTNIIELPQKHTWRNLNKKQLKKVKNSKGAIKTIFEINKYHRYIDVVVGLWFVSDSSFVVQMFKGNKDKNEAIAHSYFDLWKLNKAKKWEINQKDLHDKYFDLLKMEKGEYSLCQPMIGSKNFIFTENYVYQFVFAAPITRKDISTQDYIEQTNKYLLENNPFFYIIKLKHKFNE